ncbi:hypothetical protein D3C71_1785460 [compost metagenome]
MAIKPVRAHRRIGGAAQVQARKAALAQEIGRHAQHRLSHALAFVLRQQRKHDDFSRVAVPEAITGQLAAVDRDHARIQAGFDARAPGFLRDPGAGQFRFGHGIFTGQAAHHDAGGGVFREGGPEGKAHRDS